MSGQEAAGLVLLFGAFGIAAFGAAFTGFVWHSLDYGRRQRWCDANDFYKWQARGGLTAEPPETWTDQHAARIVAIIAIAFAVLVLAFGVAGVVTILEAPAPPVPHGTAPATGAMIPPA